MAGITHVEMAPGQIMSDAGAAQFRRVLHSEAVIRCANLWMAQVHHGAGSAIELEIYCGLDRSTDRWAVEVYYFNVERALEALREYEGTGNMPEGE